RTEMISNVEKTIHAELQNYPDAERVDLLVNRLAVARLSSVFERIYGAIFGSQIAALRGLVAQGGKVALSVAVKFYDDAKSRTPVLNAVEFDAWMAFLKNFELIRVGNDEVSITERGHEFLLYMSASNLAENKTG